MFSALYGAIPGGAFPRLRRAHAAAADRKKVIPLLYLATFFENTLSLFVSAFVLLMLARVIFNLLMPEGGGLIVNFVYAVTEAAICPVRALCDRMDWFQSVPFDMPFLLTYFVLWILQLLMQLPG